METFENNNRRNFLKSSTAIVGGLALSFNLPSFLYGVAPKKVFAASVHKLYIRDVYKNLKYRPTWLPGTPMELGTVGVIEDSIFRAITDLDQLGIQFEPAKDPDRDDIDFTSKKGVSVTFKAAGEANNKFKAIANTEAGALIEFSQEGAVVMQLRDVAMNRIKDQNALKHELLKSIAVGDESKQWQRDWVVITEVARADRATIVISNSKNSRLELKASGSTTPTSLVDASASFTVATESEISTKVIAESGLTPLFRGLRIGRKHFHLYNEVIPASTEVPPAEEVFVDADPEEDE